MHEIMQNSKNHACFMHAASGGYTRFQNISNLFENLNDAYIILTTMFATWKYSEDGTNYCVNVQEKS